MKVWLAIAGLVSVGGLVWWIQRWHERQQEYLPSNWTRRQAERAWKK